MRNQYNRMRERILDIINPNVEYTQEDFDNEFIHLATPINEDFKLNISFKNISNNPDPEYATQGASGFDIRANVDKDQGLIINSKSIGIVPTGLFFELPENFEIQIRPRSGLAAKELVTVLNTPGTIDSDYRGELKIILINHNDRDFKINNGDRIAQAIIAPVMGVNVIKLTRIDEISDNTKRSSGGFGHTGMQ